MSSALDNDKAPYLLALLISAFTWHVGQISADLTQANVVAYSRLQGPDDALTLTLANISDDRFLENNRFQLACPDGVACIDVATISPRAVAPINVTALLEPEDRQARMADIFITVSLPPSAELVIELKRVAGMPYPDFFYAPLPDNMPSSDGGSTITNHDGILLLKDCTGILTLNSCSKRVALMRSYVYIVGATFSLVFLLLVFIMSRWLWRTTRQVAAPSQEVNK